MYKLQCVNVGDLICAAVAHCSYMLVRMSVSAYKWWASYLIWENDRRDVGRLQVAMHHECHFFKLLLLVFSCLQLSSWARRLAASWAVNRHWYLSSTALNSCSTDNPVQDVMFDIHAVLGLPRLLFPGCLLSYNTNTIQITICNAPYFARRIRGAGMSVPRWKNGQQT